MLGALLPLVLSLAPQLAGMIFGPKGGDTTAKVADLIQTVAGIDPTTEDGAEAALATLRGNPQVASELRTKLAELHLRMQEEENRERENARRATLEELKTRMEDTQSARGQTIELAKSNSFLASGSMILSGIILVGFAIMLFVVLNPRNPDAANSPIANVLLGTLAAMATQVANYWLGSSSGSAAKNAALDRAQSALAQSVPLEMAKSEGRG